MTKAFITGGVAEFEKNRKVADYEIEKARITFNVGEGEDAETAVAAALTLARTYVFSALGIPVVRQSFEEKVVEGKVETTVTAPKATRSKKPPVVVVDSAKDALSLEDAPQIRTNGEDRKGPEDADPLALDAFTATVPDVTDKDISDAITRKAADLRTQGDAGVKKIKDLIAKAGVKHVSGLPQAVRAQFIADLKALA